jgi:hypothetical protein
MRDIRVVPGSEESLAREWGMLEEEEGDFAAVGGFATSPIEPRVDVIVAPEVLLTDRTIWPM